MSQQKGKLVFLSVAFFTLLFLTGCGQKNELNLDESRSLKKSENNVSDENSKNINESSLKLDQKEATTTNIKKIEKIDDIVTLENDNETGSFSEEDLQVESVISHQEEANDLDNLYDEAEF